MGLVDERLLHKPPVRFIKEVEINADTYALSEVAFQEKATLSAIVEAAAQNVMFIESLHHRYHGGVLTGIKNVKMMEELNNGFYKVKSEIVTALDNFFILKFQLFQQDKVVSEGEITVLLEKRKNEIL